MVDPVSTGIDIGAYLPAIGGIIALIIIIVLAKKWIDIYNKFVYWKTKVEAKFANIDIIMQRRLDTLTALGQVAKKYSIHEWKTMKDTIEARSRWTKDTPIGEKVKDAQDLENNFIKIQAVFEKYPRIRADKLYKRIMGHSNISSVERKLSHFRLSYNQAARDYNERVQRFPRNIIAKVHGFTKVDYLTLGNSINQGPHDQYTPKGIFED